MTTATSSIGTRTSSRRTLQGSPRPRALLELDILAAIDRAIELLQPPPGVVSRPVTRRRIQQLLAMRHGHLDQVLYSGYERGSRHGVLAPTSVLVHHLVLAEATGATVGVGASAEGTPPIAADCRRTPPVLHGGAAGRAGLVRLRCPGRGPRAGSTKGLAVHPRTRSGGRNAAPRS